MVSIIQQYRMNMKRVMAVSFIAMSPLWPWNILHHIKILHSVCVTFLLLWNYIFYCLCLTASGGYIFSIGSLLEMSTLEVVRASSCMLSRNFFIFLFCLRLIIFSKGMERFCIQREIALLICIKILLRRQNRLHLQLTSRMMFW